MKGFTLLKRGCPVCDGLKKDCRQSNESLTTVLLTRETFLSRAHTSTHL